MTFFRTDWTREMQTVGQEMDRLFSHLSGIKPPPANFMLCAFTPAVDLYETDDSLVVVAELAGLTRDDFEVLFEGRELVIKGHRPAVGSGTSRTYYQMEVCNGPFERRVVLPLPVEVDRATADLNNGFLQVVIPKVRPKPKTHLPIHINTEH